MNSDFRIRRGLRLPDNSLVMMRTFDDLISSVANLRSYFLTESPFEKVVYHCPEFIFVVGIYVTAARQTDNVGDLFWDDFEGYCKRAVLAYDFVTPD